MFVAALAATLLAAQDAGPDVNEGPRPWAEALVTSAVGLSQAPEAAGLIRIEDPDGLVGRLTEAMQGMWDVSQESDGENGDMAIDLTLRSYPDDFAGQRTSDQACGADSPDLKFTGTRETAAPGTITRICQTYGDDGTTQAFSQTIVLVRGQEEAVALFALRTIDRDNSLTLANSAVAVIEQVAESVRFEPVE
ncbi:hypothetical protein [Hyphobacterium marinum]|uniref:Sensor domain-containing protein n=1 Tax=Hyphobacterium marinum TaxID=3116574 RepID=A0ABU7LVR5_9PROT|nr:hypothetical protein [Hyphobacterium sp. Y6023]MEE2565625.1 hypothetical protein [Hyphobacterium sp. Y6023]